MRLEPAAPLSRVKHLTTEPLRSLSSAAVVIGALRVKFKGSIFRLMDKKMTTILCTTSLLILTLVNLQFFLEAVLILQVEVLAGPENN